MAVVFVMGERSSGGGTITTLRGVLSQTWEPLVLAPSASTAAALLLYLQPPSVPPENFLKSEHTSDQGISFFLVGGGWLRRFVPTAGIS